jgi:hypothetical protein
MLADLTIDVTDVNSDGTATIFETIAPMQVTSDPPPASSMIPPVSITSLQITTDGRIVVDRTTSVSGAEVPTQLGTTILSAILPDGAVEPGDTWVKTASEAMLNRQVAMSTSSTYLRNEDIGSVHAAVVETKATIPIDITSTVADLAGVIGMDASRISTGAGIRYVGRMSLDTTSWIDPSAEKLLKTQASIPFSWTITTTGVPNSIVPGGEMKLAGTLTMTMTYP